MITTKFYFAKKKRFSGANFYVKLFNAYENNHKIFRKQTYSAKIHLKTNINIE